MWFKNVSFLLAVVLMPVFSWAAHPLITDDADTQGKGKFQFEINGQYDTDEQTVDGMNVKSTGGEAASILSYGIVDSTDLVLGIPYVWGTEKNDGLKVYDEQGFSDLTVELKWRFYEKNGLNLALKPSISVPTGNDRKGLGTGKTGYAAFFILSKEMEPWTVHVNLGYKRNEHAAEIDEQKNLWHASIAAADEIVKDLHLVANIGTEANVDKASDKNPAFALVGVIYSPQEYFDLDMGLKKGLNQAESDYTYLAGITLRI